MVIRAEMASRRVPFLEELIMYLGCRIPHRQIASFFLLTLLFVVLEAIPSTSHAETTSYTCNFPVYASPSGLQKTKEMLDIRYLLDPKTKKAYILGNAGSSEVTPVQHKGGGVTFIEITDTGNVMVTAIAASGEAVHSRNGIIGKMLTPSQYYGNCTVQ